MRCIIYQMSVKNRNLKQINKTDISVIHTIDHLKMVSSINDQINNGSHNSFQELSNTVTENKSCLTLQ